jgi:hypothetical protein
VLIVAVVVAFSVREACPLGPICGGVF